MSDIRRFFIAEVTSSYHYMSGIMKGKTA